MRIDKSHRSWLILSILVLLASSIAYARYITHGPARINGPSGGSFPGLIFGIIGSAFMLFAGLLGGRKKVRTWRIGRAEFWMRGHLWLGTLSLALILFHAGFRHGGVLTSTLMWLLYAIVISGIIGAILQHYLPRAMLDSLPDETIYEQIPQVLEHLQAEARDVVSICGPENGQDLASWRKDRTAAIRARAGKALMTQERCEKLLAAVAAAPAPGAEPLKDLYLSEVKPFLESDDPRSSVFMNRARAASIFSQRRLSLAPALHEALTDIERLCDERRQLDVQRKMHLLLHGWLLIHVPLSMALLVLGVWHTIVALRYL